MTDWQLPSHLDRLDALRSDEAALAALWPTARLLTVGERGAVPVRDDGHRLRTVATEGPYDPQRHRLVGRVGETVLFATDGGSGGTPLREVGDLLPAAELQAAMAALAMVEWHRLEGRCPGCGAASVAAAGGAERRCPSCASELFPRTDPAVIVAVVDRDDRLLLGRQAVWPEGRHSVLAGFVATGESLEQAVHREVAEETGVQVTDVTYVASQPWPFPRSIMLGFTARAVTTEVRVDGTEIVAARWFTRDELRHAVATGTVGLPGRTSIAYRLVTDWLGERVEPGW